MNANTIDVVTKHCLCSSCGACSAICPHDAIVFCEVSGGYLYPQIDSSLCTNCGLCLSNCPGIQPLCVNSDDELDPFIGPVLECGTGFSMDADLRRRGQSGGTVTALLEMLFKTGKIDYALSAVMEKGDPPRGSARILSNASDLAEIQKSKYIPIPILEKVRFLPVDAKTLAVVGLPCQMHGFDLLARKHPALKNREIIKIGVFCQKVMTLSGMDYIIDQSRIRNVRFLTFRDTENTEYSGSPTVIDSKGKLHVLHKDAWSSAKEYFTPLRCRLCFDKINVLSDIACGDPHRIEGADKKKGSSLIVVRTDLGKSIIDEAVINGSAEYNPIDVQLIEKSQRIENRKNDFFNNIAVCQEMSRTIPAYHFPLKKTDNAILDFSGINRSLNLLQFSNRNKLFWDAKRSIAKTGLASRIKRKLYHISKGRH